MLSEKSLIHSESRHFTKHCVQPWSHGILNISREFRISSYTLFLCESNGFSPHIDINDLMTALSMLNIEYQQQQLYIYSFFGFIWNEGRNEKKVHIWMWRNWMVSVRPTQKITFYKYWLYQVYRRHTDSLIRVKLEWFRGFQNIMEQCPNLVFNWKLELSKAETLETHTFVRIILVQQLQLNVIKKKCVWLSIYFYGPESSNKLVPHK